MSAKYLNSWGRVQMTRQPSIQRSDRASAKLLAVFAFSFSIVFAGCAPAPQPVTSLPTAEGNGFEASPPKRITIGILGTLMALHSKVAASLISTPGAPEIAAMVNPGLAVSDEYGASKAMLAEAVPTVENGLWKLLDDGRMVTTWTLRPGIQWHDGAPLTSADVLFTARVEQDAELRVFYGPAYAALDRVEALDPRTIVVLWSKPYIDADKMFREIMPRHLLEAPYERSPQTFISLLYFNHEFVGAGAYRLGDWQDGSHLVLRAHADFVLGRPKIHEIVIRFIPDSNTLAANVLANAVDMTLSRNLSTEQAIQVRNLWRDGAVDPGPAKSWIGLYPQFIDPSPAVTLDVNFRRALVHAIDRELLVNELMFGMTAVAHGVIAPDQPEYAKVAPVIINYEYDPRKAVQMIETLGHTRGADGVMRDASNQQVTLHIQSSAGNDLQVKTMYSVAEFWTKIGLNVETDLVPAAARSDFARRSARPGFESQRQGTGVSGSFNSYHSREIPLASNNWVGGNRARYSNPAFDALIDRLIGTIAQTERLELIREVVQHMSQQLTIMGMLYDLQPTLTNHRLQGAVVPPGVTPFWNVHLWDVK